MTVYVPLNGHGTRASIPHAGDPSSRLISAPHVSQGESWPRGGALARIGRVLRPVPVHQRRQIGAQPSAPQRNKFAGV